MGHSIRGHTNFFSCFKMIVISNSKPISHSLVVLLSEGYSDRIEVKTFDGFLQTNRTSFFQKKELIILDLNSLFVNSLVYIRRIRNLAPGSRIIALDLFRESILTDSILAAGADEYLPIECSKSLLEKVLQEPLTEANTKPVDIISTSF